MNTRTAQMPPDMGLCLFSFDDEGNPSIAPELLQPSVTVPVVPSVPSVPNVSNVPSVSTVPSVPSVQKKVKPVAAKPATKPKPAKKAVPTALLNYKLQKTLYEFLSDNGYTGILVNGRQRNVNSSGFISSTSKYDRFGTPIINNGKYFEVTSLGSNKYGFHIAHVDDNGDCWTNQVTFETSDSLNSWNPQNVVSSGFSLGKKWDITGRLYTDAFFDQSVDTIMEILDCANKWGHDFVLNSGCKVKNYIMAPQLETLHKAGYRFAKKLFNPTQADADAFNRLCGPGTKPKDIFKTSKTVYSVLKHEDDMNTWGVFRRLDKTGRISQDCVQQAYDFGLKEKELEMINSILAKKHNGKNIFSWESLTNYLGRIDTYEAVSRSEGLILINDYLTMCATLKVAPRTDSDSIRREHDVMARIVSQKRAADYQRKKELEEEEKDPQKRLANKSRHDKENEAYGFASQYDYSENVYSIRGIKNFDDLLDEASQQANCVAAYHERIVTGQTLIFTMRETAHPEKSLITLELSPDGRTIRQKYLAHNKAIHNKSQSDFIDRWFQHVKAVNKQNNP